MTTLMKFETAGLRADDRLVLNSWGARQVTKAIKEAGYSQTLLEDEVGTYEGKLDRLWEYDKRRVRFQLKGSTVVLSIHKGVDYFKEVVKKV